MGFDKELLTDLKGDGESRLPKMVSWEANTETQRCQLSRLCDRKITGQQSSTATILNTNMTWLLSACQHLLRNALQSVLYTRLTSVWHFLSRFNKYFESHSYVWHQHGEHHMQIASFGWRNLWLNWQLFFVYAADMQTQSSVSLKGKRKRERDDEGMNLCTNFFP